MATPTAGLSLNQVSTWTNGVGTYPQPVPGAPQSLTATAVGSNRIDLSLASAPVAATQTEWNYKATSSSTWLTTNTAVTITTLQVTSLLPSTSYDFRARYNALNGFSAYTSVVTTSTVTAPSVPVISSVTAVNSSTLTVAFSSFPSNATTMTLQRSTSATFTSPTSFTISSPNVSYTDTGLVAGTLYYYRASATGAGGTSAYSTVVSGTTAGSGGTSWQIPAGYYHPSKQQPAIIYPRVDASSDASERHRLAPAGRKWICPVSVFSGAWPFKYSVDATSSAKGISIGQTLDETTDELVVGTTYAELWWDSPTIGSHSITVTVQTQEFGRNTSGFADQLTITFTLVVVDANDTSKFIWLSPTSGSPAGNDSTGTGSLTAPYATLAKAQTLSGSGKQLHMLPGTYNLTGFSSTSNVVGGMGVGQGSFSAVTGDATGAKPNISMGAVSAVQNSIFQMAPRSYLGSITFTEAGISTIQGNTRVIYLAENTSGQMTCNRLDGVNLGNGTAGDDNPTLIWSARLDTVQRTNIVISRCTETGRPYQAGSTHEVFGVYSVINCVFEFNTCSGGGSASAMQLKDTCLNCTVRANDARATVVHGHAFIISGQSLPASAGNEISYNNCYNYQMQFNEVGNMGANWIFRNSSYYGIDFFNPPTTGVTVLDSNAVGFEAITTGTNLTLINNLVNTTSSAILNSAGQLTDVSPNFYKTNYFGKRGKQLAKLYG